MRRPLCMLAAILAAFCVQTAWADTESAQTAAIVAPPNGATIHGGQVDITVSFNSDKEHPVSRVQVFLDGKPVTKRVYETPLAQGACSFKWDTVRTPNGRHKLDIQVFSGDEYLAMASCTVTVANQAPDLAIPRIAVLSPREGETVSGITPITIHAYDNSGQEPLVSVYIDKSLRCMKNRGPYTYEWDTTKDENGPHAIEATAVDDSSNRADLKPIRVIVRNPGKPMPIRAREDSDMAEALDRISRSVPVLPDLPSASATSGKSIKRSGAGEQEYARTVPEAGSIAAERFEIEQTAAPVANLPSLPALDSSIPHVELKESPAPDVPAAEEKPASADVIETTTPPEPPTFAQAASESTTAPALVARLAGTDSVRPTIKADCRLAAPPTPAGGRAIARASNAPRSNEYVVQAGDSVIRLAKRFGVSVEAIVESNGIQDPQMIRIGDKLRIPANAKMVPIRPIFEEAGGTVIWDHSRRSVHAVCPQNDVTLKIGEAEATVNEEQVAMDRPAVIRSGRTLVAESFVAKTLGMAATGR